MNHVLAAVVKSIKNVVDKVIKILFLWCFIIMLLLVVFDQITKKAAVRYLENITSKKIGIFKLMILENRGVAFGMFSRYKNLVKYGVGVCIITIFAYMFYISFVCISGYEAFYVSVILGGAIGNYWDRINKGYVIDFIGVKFNRMFVFNFADFFILIGSIGYLSTQDIGLYWR
jgi:signal peptidase II